MLTAYSLARTNESSDQSTKDPLLQILRKHGEEVKSAPGVLCKIGSLTARVDYWLKQIETNPTANNWCALGDCFWRAHEESQLNKAFICYQKALLADPNFVRALNNLGHCYYLGIGTTVNEKAALDHYSKAVSLDSNFAPGWNHLGYCYEFGKGTEKDEERAFRCYKHAVQLHGDKPPVWEDNYGEADNPWDNLSRCYQLGRGTVPNDCEASINTKRMEALIEKFNKLPDLPNNPELKTLPRRVQYR